MEESQATRQPSRLGIKCPREFHLPYIRSHPGVNTHGTMRHISVSSCWKDLCVRDNQDLTKMQATFLSCLEGLLDSDIRYHAEVARNLATGARDLALQLHWQRDPQSRTLRRVDDMTATCDVRFPIYHHQLVNRIRWEMFPLNLEPYIRESRLRLFQLYLASMDCLKPVQGSNTTIIPARIVYDESSRVTGHRIGASWFPDDVELRFSHHLIERGETFSISPKYIDRAIFRCAEPSAQACSYRIQNCPEWIQWDETDKRFHGKMPMDWEPEERMDTSGEDAQAQSQTSNAEYLRLIMVSCYQQWIIGANGNPIAFEKSIRSELTFEVPRIDDSPEPRASSSDTVEAAAPEAATTGQPATNGESDGGIE